MQCLSERCEHVLIWLLGTSRKRGDSLKNYLDLHFPMISQCFDGGLVQDFNVLVEHRGEWSVVK
eukprot:4005270-Lingulodinium_polyedra.AAC.1